MKQFINRLFAGFGTRVISNRRAGIDSLIDVIRVFELAREQPSVVFDVGANIGLKTLEFARSFPGATIHSFEPFPATFSILERRVRRFSNVTAHPFGFSNRSESLECAVVENSELNSLVSPSASMPGQATEVVVVKTIDEFCHESDINRISLLKTDTEGFDLRVLEGAAQMLGSERVDLIVCEVGFAAEDTRHTSFQSVHAFLESFNYRLLSVSEQSVSEYRILLDYCNVVYASERLRRAARRGL